MLSKGPNGIAGYLAMRFTAHLGSRPADLSDLVKSMAALARGLVATEDPDAIVLAAVVEAIGSEVLEIVSVESAAKERVGASIN